MMRLVKLIRTIRIAEVLLFLGLLLFSVWLMFHTFSYDGKTQTMLIAKWAMSDFGSHIPLIRSFSLGDNLTRMLKGKPAEYPLFPGEPIRYHFLFYALVGFFERIGIRLDLALNIPSIIGFFLLMVAIYALSVKLFHDRRIAVLSLLFFLFNGSLSFIPFFPQFPLSMTTISDIVNAHVFPAFAPWGPGDISAFWNLNIYTNQRHLALAFSLALLFVYTLIALDGKKYKTQLPWAILWGLVLGLFPFFHQPTLVIFALIGVIYFLLWRRLRWLLMVIGGVAAILLILQIPLLTYGVRTLSYYPGYLVHDSLIGQKTIFQATVRFLSYWFQNLGGHMVLIPIGFLLVDKRVKKVFLPIFLLFLVANLFKFSIEVAASHKFFNFFLILGNMLSAFVIVRLIDHIKMSSQWVIGLLGYLSIGLLVVFLTLSGIIDFFVIANDRYVPIRDIPANEEAAWFLNHTPTEAIVLNSSFLYHPASLAGRKIFLGWAYFPWSAGYDTEKRSRVMRQIYESDNEKVFCPLLRRYAITYITVEDTKDDPNLPAIDVSYFVSNFSAVYQNSSRNYYIFTATSLCANVL